MNLKPLSTIVWSFPQKVDGCGQEVLHMNAEVLLTQSLYTNISVCADIYLIGISMHSCEKYSGRYAAYFFAEVPFLYCYYIPWWLDTCDSRDIRKRQSYQQRKVDFQFPRYLPYSLFIHHSLIIIYIPLVTFLVYHLKTKISISNACISKQNVVTFLRAVRW